MVFFAKSELITFCYIRLHLITSRPEALGAMAPRWGVTLGGASSPPAGGGASPGGPKDAFSALQIFKSF